MKVNKKKRMLDELRNSLGNVTIACRACGLDRHTHYTWLKKDESYKQSVEDILEEQGDYVENKLLQRVKDDDTTAIIFYCKTKLKGRGYVERHEVSADINSVALGTDMDAIADNLIKGMSE